MLSVAAHAQNDEPEEQVRRYRLHHVWGRFRPGTWKLVRVHTESFDEGGAVAASSVSEQRLTLADVTDEGVKLRVESTVEVAGKKLDAPPQDVEEGFLDQAAGPGTERGAVKAELAIGSRRYLCRIVHSETSDGQVRRVVRNWVCDDAPPFVLRRESEAYSMATGEKLNETTMEVVGLASRRTILGRLRTTAEMREVTVTSKGSVVTRGWECPDVPGGVIRQQTEEFDPQNQLIRRSRMELVDYSIVR